jgi:hypothetical protein
MICAFFTWGFGFSFLNGFEAGVMPTLTSQAYLKQAECTPTDFTYEECNQCT